MLDIYKLLFVRIHTPKLQYEVPLRQTPMPKYTTNNFASPGFALSIPRKGNPHSRCYWAKIQTVQGTGQNRNCSLEEAGCSMKGNTGKWIQIESFWSPGSVFPFFISFCERVRREKRKDKGHRREWVRTNRLLLKVAMMMILMTEETSIHWTDTRTKTKNMCPSVSTLVSLWRRMTGRVQRALSLTFSVSFNLHNATRSSHLSLDNVR